jgi:hypothetical protein
MVSQKSEAEKVQNQIDELSKALARAVKAVKDGKISLVEHDYLSEEYKEKGLRIWNTLYGTEIGKYGVYANRGWTPPEKRGEVVEDSLWVEVRTPSQSKHHWLGLGAKIVNRDVWWYRFTATPTNWNKYDYYEIFFDAKGKVTEAIPRIAEFAMLRCETIPKSYIPKFPTPK